MLPKCYAKGFNKANYLMIILHTYYIGDTWARWHLKSAASRLFVQQLVHTDSERIKASHYCPFTHKSILCMAEQGISQCEKTLNE